MDELTLAVVGIDYPNADKSKSSRRMELMICAPGEPVALRLEPRNEFDEWAVAVFSQRGVQLGYLTSQRAPYITKRIKAGEDLVAIYQGLVGKAGYIRVRFDGGQPAVLPLPAATPAALPEFVDPLDDTFVPDPDGPDWGA